MCFHLLPCSDASSTALRSLYLRRLGKHSKHRHLARLAPTQAPFVFQSAYGLPVRRRRERKKRKLLRPHSLSVVESRHFCSAPTFIRRRQFPKSKTRSVLSAISWGAKHGGYQKSDIRDGSE